MCDILPSKIASDHKKKLLMISKKKLITQTPKVTNQLPLLARVMFKHLRRRFCFVNFVQKTEEQGILT